MRIIVMLGSMIGLMAQSFVHAENLAEAMKAAQISHPLILAEKAVIEANHERLIQARAAGGLSVYMEYGLGHGIVRSEPIIGNPEDDRQLTRAQLFVTRPLYTGGRIDAGIARAKAGVDLATSQLLAIRQQIFLETVIAYSNVLSLREEVTLRQYEHNLLQKQFIASKDRFSVGIVTQTDVAQTQARLAAADARLIEAEARLNTAEIQYWSVVGHHPKTLQPIAKLPQLPDNFDAALQIALQNNPRLSIQRSNEVIAKQRVKAAKGALKPEVLFSAIAEHQQAFGSYSGENSSVNMLGQMRVPLYESGTKRSVLRGAKFEQSRARKEVELARRNVIVTLSQAWSIHHATLEQLEAARRRVEAAKIAYDGADSELTAGFRTTVEVLDQGRELMQAELDLIHTNAQSHISAYQILSILGVFQ